MKTMSVIVAMVLLALMSMTSFAADWPNWRGPNLDGISTEKAWDPLAVNGAAPIWKAEVGVGFSTMVVADGKVLTMGNIEKKTDVVWCFDAKTGKLLWKKEYPEPLSDNLYEGGPNATPTIADGRVYTLSKSGKVFCLNLQDGSVIWNRELGIKVPEWGFAGSPYILGDWLILNVSESGATLNKNTGRTVWQGEDKPAGYATPVKMDLNGTTQLVVFGAEQVQGVNSKTGAVTWSYPWKTNYGINASDPIVNGSEIFLTSGYNFGCGLFKLEAGQLVKVWQNKNMRSQLSGPVVINGFIYGIDDAQLVCLDWKTGVKKWAEPAVAKGTLMAADGKLIVLSEKGKLMVAAASPEKFAPIASAQILDGRCWTMPTLANGKIYARNAKGTLVCVDVAQKKTVALAEMGTAPVEQPAWPRWKGIKQDNISTETGLMKQWPEQGPAMLWQYEGLGEGFASVSVADGRIYTVGMVNKEGFLTCLDMNGKLVWKVSYGPEWSKSVPGVRGTPTLDGDKVYVISGVGRVLCFNAADGKEIWQKNPFSEFGGKYGIWGIAESAVIDGDALFFVVGGSKATMVALNKNTGDTLWASDSIGDTSSYCTPLLVNHGGRKILTMLTADHIVGVDAANGKILWTVAVTDFAKRSSQINPNTPVSRDGMIFYTSGYDQGAIMLKLNADGSAVETLWTNPEFDNHHGSVVLLGDYLYGPNWKDNGNGDWLCVEWKTGKTVYTTHWENKGSLTCAEGMLYCYEEKNGIVALVKADPAGFTPISMFKVPAGEGPHWGHPVVCGKRLYIRHGDVLMVYNIAA